MSAFEDPRKECFRVFCEQIYEYMFFDFENDQQAFKDIIRSLTDQQKIFLQENWPRRGDVELAELFEIEEHNAGMGFLPDDPEEVWEVMDQIAGLIGRVKVRGRKLPARS